jgi:rubrerythrin
MGRWRNEDIDWSRFDPARVDADILATVKAAALVEQNAPDYVAYLYNVFRDDPRFQEAACNWGAEEEQHGHALSAWAMKADPQWDFEAALARFRANYSLPRDAARSVRGSQTGELIARCVVECGTSSLYSALRDACDEPALKQIASRIAADEFRHYKLFYDHFLRYDETQSLNLLQRLRVAFGRIAETEDDELAVAYWAANCWHEPYDRVRHSAAYGQRAGRLYRFGHVQRAVGMVLKACKVNPQGRLSGWMARISWSLLQRRNRTWARVAGNLGVSPA